MADHDPRADEELLEAAQHEPDAFAVFYRRHARLVLGVAARRLGDPELAADVTSEVFAAALAASARFDRTRGSARAWLFGILAHQVASAQRRGAAESRARRRLGMEPVALADDQRAWVEALAREQDGALAMRLLAELPERDRALLAQRVVAERGYADLAAELGSTEPALRQRVSRGLALLRTRFLQSEVAR